MSIEITTADGLHGLQRFIGLPHDIYRDGRHYVPQLAMQQRGLLDGASPFREHAEMQLFLARRGGRVVGRVAAIDNRLLEEHGGRGRGTFGFFDCEDDVEASGCLFDACRAWLADRGVAGLWGPVNPDLNNSCGILTEGFDRAPAIFMPYNAPYYAALLESAGLRVVKRLNAWDIHSDRVPEEVLNDADLVGARLAARGFTVRPVDFGHFRRDVSRLRPVYNEAMAGSWGHTPLSESEFMDQARGLRFICPPDFIQVAEHEGRVAGFMGVAPDLNQVLRRIDRGRLLPLGWARLLAGRRKIRWGRIVMYGVLPRHRGTGLAVWLYATIIRALFARGYLGAEASYVLEDNQAVNDISIRVGGTLAKRYALYGLTGDGEVDDAAGH